MHTYVSGYDVEMDIKSDRSISVIEDITVYFHYNSGFICDIPVNGGELIKNVKVIELIDGKPDSVYYNVFTEDSSFVSIDIGDSSTKSDEHTYRITYDYLFTKAQEGKNVLSLTPIGSGWPCEIENARVTLKLPEGYVNGSASVFIQPVNNNSITILPFDTQVVEGRTVITTSEPITIKGQSNGYSGEALRVDLQFEEGALTTYFDSTPYWFVLAAVVILVLVIVIKFLAFNKDGLTPVVNFEAPNKMNPLLMGKLIDNSIDSEDITSMIFYWADKGYLKINFDNQKDPTIIRIMKALPADAPDYEQLMYANMFNGADVVRPSELKNKFYVTIDKVKRMVNGRTKGLYSAASTTISRMLAIIAGLLPGIAPLVIALTQISLTFLIIAPFISIIPLLVVYGSCSGLRGRGLNSKKSAKIIYACITGVICLVLTLAYTIFVPSFIIGILPKILLCLLSCAAVGLSVILISKNKSYVEQLNEIVGFKNFIELAEKDRLETMLEENPQFYYHVLPFAQVLGVSDKWEEKFKEITVEPPQWATCSTTDTLLNFYVMNRIMNVSFASMTTNMASRPSSSGSSGGGHGSFGGFSGGGHGGGGGRFR